MNKKVKWVGILSTAERNHIGLIRVRQNNVNSEILGFEIIDGNGEPYDLKNRKVLFCTYFDRFAPVEQYAEVIENGKIIYTMNEHDMQKPVRINFAYFKIMDEKDNLVDTTQNFSYNIMPSIESKCMNSEPYIIRLEEMLEVFANVRDESTKELEKIITDFNERVIKQQEDFDKWFESIRDILESIDPNGKMLTEVIGGRYSNIVNKEFSSLAERNKFTDNKIIEVERKTTSNDWLKDLNGSYIAHKGFTGMKYDGPIKEGLYPDNSRKSFEAAGNLGYKAIETDLVRCKDGFIISHEENTMLLDGPLTMFKDMTISEIKERNIIKQPIGGGSYATLTGSNANYKILTLEECFDICKRFNMYIVLDVRFMTDYPYTDKDINDLVKLVKDANMEKFCMWYGNSNYKICNILKDSTLAVASINETDVEEAIKYIKKYNNYTFSVGETSYLKYATWAKEFDIPLMVWTIDEYFKADDVFFNGANCVLTNRLLKNANADYLKVECIDEQIYFRQNGQGTYSFENEVHKFETDNYLSRYHYIPKNTLNKGDIVRVRASGRTTRSDSVNMFGRIIIDNSLSGNKLIRSLSFFKTDNFEEREVYFVVSDVTEDISINIGLAGGGFTGSASCEIKDIEIEVLTNAPIKEDVFGLIYAYNGTIAIRPGFVSNGIKSVKKNATDASIIDIEYNLKRLHNLKPVVLSSLDAYSTQNTYKIIPLNVDISAGILKVKFLDNNNQIVKDVNTLQLAFSILIK